VTVCVSSGASSGVTACVSEIAPALGIGIDIDMPSQEGQVVPHLVGGLKAFDPLPVTDSSMPVLFCMPPGFGPAG